jgi:hypothetical protein
MALKLQPNPTFWTPVPISVPGSEKPAIVDIEFVHKTKEQIKDFYEALQKEDRSDEAILGDIIKTWKGIDAEYSPSALRDLLSNYPASGLEILKAYGAALTESRRKNS